MPAGRDAESILGTSPSEQEVNPEPASRLPHGTLHKIAEGREAEIFRWGPDTVLRLYRDPSAHELAARELLALEAVRTALPTVPAPRGRRDWEGRPGLLMEYVEGRSLLAELQRRPWRFLALAALTGRVHAELHGVRAPEALPTLRRALAARIEGTAAIPQALRSAALEQLERLPDGDALCHGDFQPDNVLLCRSGPVVIDWARATRGDDAGDFARTSLMMRLGALPPGAPALIRHGRHLGGGLFRRAYLRGYGERRRHDRAAVHRWELVRAVERLADGIPEERSALLREAELLRASLPAQ